MKKIMVYFMALILALTMVSPMTAFAAEETLLQTDKEAYAATEIITVTAIGTGADWVGIYEKGSIPADGNPAIAWYYVDGDGNESGVARAWEEVDFLEPGEYTINLLANDGYEILASVDITIGEAAELLATDKEVYAASEIITVTAVGTGADWVGIYEKGSIPADGNPAIAWYYVDGDGNESGVARAWEEVDFLEPGEYTINLLANDGYEILASVDITVEAAEQTPAEEPMEEPEEEPVQESAPVSENNSDESNSSTGLYIGVAIVVIVVAAAIVVFMKKKK